MVSQEGLQSEETIGSKDPDNSENQDTERGEATMEPKGYDPKIVDWDGPDDPENPMNWSGFRKGLHIAYVSLFVLYAYVSSRCTWPS